MVGLLFGGPLILKEPNDASFKKVTTTKQIKSKTVEKWWNNGMSKVKGKLGG